MLRHSLLPFVMTVAPVKGVVEPCLQAKQVSNQRERRISFLTSKG
jgi:hypothetical protein